MIVDDKFGLMRYDYEGIWLCVLLKNQRYSQLEASQQINVQNTARILK